MRIAHPRIVLGVVLVMAGVVAAAYAWSYWPPAAATKSAAERAIVGYELAPAPIWPVKYYGLKKMTPAIAADIRAGYARNLRLYATGHVLAFLLHRNMPGGGWLIQKSRSGTLIGAGADGNFNRDMSW